MHEIICFEKWCFKNISLQYSHVLLWMFAAPLPLSLKLFTVFSVVTDTLLFFLISSTLATGIFFFLGVGNLAQNYSQKSCKIFGSKVVALAILQVVVSKPKWELPNIFYASMKVNYSKKLMRQFSTKLPIFIISTKIRCHIL